MRVRRVIEGGKARLVPPLGAPSEFPAIRPPSSAGPRDEARLGQGEAQARADAARPRKTAMLRQTAMADYVAKHDCLLQVRDARRRVGEDRPQRPRAVGDLRELRPRVARPTYRRPAADLPSRSCSPSPGSTTSSSSLPSWPPSPRVRRSGSHSHRAPRESPSPRRSTRSARRLHRRVRGCRDAYAGPIRAKRRSVARSCG